MKFQTLATGSELSHPRTPMTEQVVRSMRLACRKISHSVGGTEYYMEMARPDTDPYCWWYDNKMWFLSIRCRHNSHGEYYLSLGQPHGDEGWFCFLQDGKWGKKFLHLRHVHYFNELQLIVNALTGLFLFENEAEAKAWLDENPDPQ